ncbi:nicotinate-nucleotide--dimethylbenzimidazole phosphoribosyltransferase, partial [Amycolatopsis sp. NPDC051114]
MEPEDIEFPEITPPDDHARSDAIALHDKLVKPAGSLGRLEELGVWIAACQGQSPPRPFTRPRVIVFAGDHGIAAKGVSAYPAEVTAQLLGTMLTGGAAINVLAAAAGASVRVVDMAVDTEAPATRSIGEYKVRRGSGSIDVEDALTADEVKAAIRAGIAIADAEVDGGADLLIPGDLGIGNSTPASVLVAALTGTEPVA